MAALAAKLTDEQARQAIEPVLAAMKGTTDPDALQALGQGLAALPVELTAEQAWQAIAPVLASMAGTNDWKSLQAVGQGLAALAPKAITEQARESVAPLLTAMQRTTTSYALRDLAQGLAAFTAKLPAEEAVQSMVDAMKIPWMAGEPSKPLLQALQAELGDVADPPTGLWDLIAQIERQFGKAIDLTTPPKPPAASAGA